MNRHPVHSPRQQLNGADVCGGLGRRSRILAMEGPVTRFDASRHEAGLEHLEQLLTRRAQANRALHVRHEAGTIHAASSSITAPPQSPHAILFAAPPVTITSSVSFGLSLSQAAKRSPGRHGDAGSLRTIPSPPMPTHVS